MKKSGVTVAGIAMSCELYDKEANVRKALRYIDDAAEIGAQIVLLQEVFSTGYVIYHLQSEKTRDLAESIPGPTTDRIAEKAREHGIYVISPIYEKAGPGLYYNSAPVLNPDGEIIGVQRKTHIVGGFWGGEGFYWRIGHEYKVFDTEFGRFGVIICYDRHFPENWRNMVLGGAEIVFVPAAASYPHWDIELRVMSYQNNVFTVAVNRVGEETMQHASAEFPGTSLIANPMGDILAKLKRGVEGVISYTINLEEVDRARRETAFFYNLRPELYKRLSDPLVS